MDEPRNDRTFLYEASLGNREASLTLQVSATHREDAFEKIRTYGSRTTRHWDDASDLLIATTLRVDDLTLDRIRLADLEWDVHEYLVTLTATTGESKTLHLPIPANRATPAVRAAYARDVLAPPEDTKVSVAPLPVRHETRDPQAA